MLLGADYATVKGGVDAVLNSSLCTCTADEVVDLKEILATLKRRGHTGRKSQKRPLTIVDIWQWFAQGKIKCREVIVLTLTFCLAMRKSEAKKLDTSLKCSQAGKIHLWHDGTDLCMDFSKASTKSNLYGVVRCKCFCRALADMGMPSYLCLCQFKKNIPRLGEPDLDVEKILKKAESSVSFGTHSFRIGAACMLFSAEMDINRILVHCRWTSLDMLLTYIRNITQVKKEKFVDFTFAVV